MEKSHIKEKVHNKHDNYFRENMSNIEISREFLEKFLDKEVLDRIDLSTLSKLNDNYVTKKNESYFTDALYQVALDDNSREGYLYVLLEHKSYPAHGVIFQLLEYLAQIYQRHYNHKKGKVPIVIPIVVYHGITKWNIEREFLKYVDIDLEKDLDLLKYIPNFFYKLYDLPRMNISFENYTSELKTFILALMIRTNKEQFEELIIALDKLKSDDNFKMAANYILDVLDEKDIKQFNKLIVEKQEELNRREEIMTMAQALREEGRQEGIEKGRKEGEENLIQSMLKKGVTVEMVASMTGLSIERIEEIYSKVKKLTLV